jgi:hypothetical protein
VVVVDVAVVGTGPRVVEVLVAVEVSNRAGAAALPHAAVTSRRHRPTRRTGKEYHGSQSPPVA